MGLPNDSVISILDAQISEIQSVSPSNYLTARVCPLKFILSKSKLWQYSPDNAAAVVGTAIHRLIEWSGKNQSSEVTHAQAEAKFDELIKLAEDKLCKHPVNRRLIPLSVSDPRFPEKKHSAIKAAIRGPKQSRHGDVPPKFGMVRTMYEEGFSSGNGLIYGEIDKLVDGPSGLIIYDKKTCQVIDENGYIKNDYRMQLLLYAGIVYECIGKMASRLVLVDCNNTEIEVTFKPEEALEAIAVASRWLTSLNKKIALSSTVLQLLPLAQPSPEVCRFCASRSACPAYWKARQAVNDDWPVDAEFLVDSCQQLGNGGKLIYASPIALGRSMKTSLNDINCQPAISKIERGSKIRLIDVKKTGNQFSLTKNSVVYLINETTTN